MAEFTANQIEEIVSIIANEFSKQATPQETVQGVARGVTQYVGARYVPLFAEPLEWDPTREYEALTIVLHEGNSYTSRQYVPTGIEIGNDSFWAITGNYNAQVEAYRAEVKSYDARIKAVEAQSAQAVADAKTANDAVATEKERAIARETEIETQLDTAIKAEASRAQAAEEATNAEVAKNTTAIATNKQAIADEKTERMEDTETLTSQLAGTSDSGLKDLIEERATELESSKLDNRLNVSDYVVPEYVGDFVAYNGKFFGDDQTGSIPSVNQGYCYNGTDHVFGLSNSDNTKQKIAKANEESNTYSILSKVYTDFGHINCMAYNDSTSHYYVYTGTPIQNVVILDKNLNTVKTLSAPSSNYGNIAYDRKTGKVWYVEYTGDVYELVDESTFSKKDYTLSYDYLASEDEIGQGCAVYDGILVMPLTGVSPTNKSGFKVYDVTNGKFIKCIATPNTQPIWGEYGEWEDCDFDSEGNLYVTSIRNNATDTATTYASVNFLWKTNIYKNTLNATVIRSASEFVIEANYNGFKHYGSSAYPFYDLAEWNLAVATNPVFIKKSNFSLNNNDAVTFNGLVFFDRPVNCTLHFNGQNNVTINGVLSFRGGGNVAIRNRLQLKECNNAPFTYLLRVSNGQFISGSVYGTKNETSGKVTDTMLLEGPCLVCMGGLYLDGATATPAHRNLTGFGYVIGNALLGKYPGSE